MPRSLPACAAFLVALIAAPGCSSQATKPTFPVRGQVYVASKPAGKALVIFTPLADSEPANWPNGFPHATVRDDGCFALTTNNPDDGAPAGEYAVTFLWMQQVEGDEEADFDKLEGRYADPSTSTFRVTVNADRQGMTVPPFHLD